MRTLVSITSIRHKAVKPARLRMPQPAGAAGSAADTFTGSLRPAVASSATSTSNAHASASAPNTVMGTCHGTPATNSRLTAPPNANLPTSPKKL